MPMVGGADDNGINAFVGKFLTSSANVLIGRVSRLATMNAINETNVAANNANNVSQVITFGR